jgi:hypothetical protein
MTPPLPPVPPDDNDPDPAWAAAVKAMKMGNAKPMIGYHLRSDDPYVQSFQTRFGRGPSFEESQHELGRRYDAMTSSPGVPGVDQPTSGLRDPYLHDTPTPGEREVLNAESERDLRSLSPLEAAKRWGAGWIKNAVGVVKYPLDLLGAETRKIFGPTPAERANRGMTPPAEPTQAEILGGLNPVEQAKALGKQDPFTALGSIAGMATGGEILHAPFEAARVLDARRAVAPEIARGADAATLKLPAGEARPVAAPVPPTEPPARPESFATSGLGRARPATGASGLEGLQPPTPQPDLERPTFERRGGKVLEPVGPSYESIVPYRPAEEVVRAAPSVDRTNLNLPTYLRNLEPEQLAGALRRDPDFWRSEKGTATLAAMAAAGVTVPGSIIGALSDPDDRKRGAALGVLTSLMLAGGVAVGGREMLERTGEEPSRYAKVDDAALQARHFEVLDRLQRASQDAGEGIQPWTRWDDDEHIMRSGTAVSGKAGRAIGRAKDDARILSEIEGEFARRGVSSDELLDRYVKRTEREGIQAEAAQSPSSPPAGPPGPPSRPPAPPTPPEPPSGPPSEPPGGPRPPRVSLPTNIVPPDYATRIKAKFPASVAGDVAARAVEVVQEQGLNPNRPVTWSETQAAANQLALNPSEVSQVRALKLSAPELKATVDVVNRDAKTLVDLHRQIAAAPDEATASQLRAKADAIEQRMADGESVLMRASSQKGRDLNILRKMAADTRDPSAWLVKATRTAGRTLGDEERAQILALIDKGDAKGLAQYVGGLKYGTTTQGLLHAWVAGLISSPAIFGKALAGQMTLTSLELAKDPVATAFDQIASGALALTKGGKWSAFRTKTFNGDMLAATAKGWKTGLEAGLERLGPAKAASLGGVVGAATGAVMPGTAQERLERAAAGVAIGGLAAGGAGPLLKRLPPEAAPLPEGVVGPYDRPSLRYENPIVQAVNTYYADVVGNSHGVYMSAAWRSAYERAIAEQVAVAKMRGLDVPAEGTAEMQMRAAEYGAQQSLTSRTGPVAKTAIAMKRAAGNVGTVAMPIAVVPANALERLASYSPFGLAAGIKDAGVWVRAAMRDDPGLSDIQRRMVERLARGTIGTGPIVAGYILASRGLLTGPLPTDPEQRRLFDALGKKPWAIKYGKEWHSIGAVAPAGMLLGVGAALHDIVQDQALSTGGKVAAGALAGGKLVAEQPFLQGPSQAVKALQDPKEAQRELEQLAASTVPASGFARHIAEASDTLERAPSNVKEAVEAEIPGLREQVPAKQGAFGESVKRGGGAAERLLDFTRPSRARSETNPVYQEIERVGAAPSQPKRIAGETAQEFFRRNQAGGKDAFELVKRVINSPMYRGADIIAKEVYRNPAAIAKYPELAGMDLPAATRWLQKTMIEQAVSAGRERVNALTSGTKFLERLHQATDTTGSPR